MKNTILTLATVVLATTIAFGGQLNNVDNASRIALQGYDPTSFFSAEGEPVKGDPSISATHEGVTYLFATGEAKAEFEKNPAKYEPAYGGYCAYGVAKGALFPVDISTAKVVNGRLMLNYSPAVAELFAADEANFIKDADTNWPKIATEKGK